jgi:hypothetical protein
MDDIGFQSGEFNPLIEYVKIGNKGVGEISLEGDQWRFHHWGGVTGRLSAAEMAAVMAAVSDRITILTVTHRLLKER